MIRETLEFSRQTETQFLKSSGARTEGVVGTIAVVEAMPGIVQEGLLSGAHRLGYAMEAFARSEAPWVDRTGNLRRGLHALAGETGTFGVFAGVAHDAALAYALWIEMKANGKWGIIARTQEAFATRAAGIMAGEVNLELRGAGSKFRYAAGTGQGGRFA